MLARLILALLLAAFALPAMAASPCHEGGVMAAMTMSDHPGKPAPPHDAVAGHVCIGCVPPSNWASAPIVTPLATARAPRVWTAARLDPGAGYPPVLPPPRGA